MTILALTIWLSKKVQEQSCSYQSYFSVYILLIYYSSIVAIETLLIAKEKGTYSLGG